MVLPLPKRRPLRLLLRARVTGSYVCREQGAWARLRSPTEILGLPHPSLVSQQQLGFWEPCGGFFMRTYNTLGEQLAPFR